MSNDVAANSDAAMLVALASGMSTKETAAQAGVSDRTVQRRLNDPEFKLALQQHRAELVSRALGQLSIASGEAVTTLRDLLGAEADSVRLGAAKTILELVGKLRASVELEARIAELERQNVIVN